MVRCKAKVEKALSNCVLEETESPGPVDGSIRAQWSSMPRSPYFAIGWLNVNDLESRYPPNVNEQH